jgi:hypothetical protein
VKKPKLLLAALALVIGAASAAGWRPAAGGSDENGESAMLVMKKLYGRNGS